MIAGLTGNISGAIILGTGTASDTANDIMERGGTEEEALIGGAVSGINVSQGVTRQKYDSVRT